MKRVLGRLLSRNNTSAETDTNKVAASASVTGGLNAPSLMSRVSRLKVWHKIVLLVFILGVVTIAIYVVRHQEPPATFTTLPTEQEYFDSKVAKLLASPPKADETAEKKAAYYGSLSHAYAEVKKYPESISAFKQWEAADSKDLTYFDYIDLARYYHETGNKTQALAAIDKALSLLPPDDPEIGYLKDEHAARIKELRKAYE